MIGHENYETNFPHKLLLTDKQTAVLCKAFADNSSANIKLSKTQLSKTMKSNGFLGRLPGPLIKFGLLLMKNLLKPLAKSILLP